MAESKIDFSFENLHFSIEGNQDWVELQLNQMLNRMADLSNSGLFAKSEKIKLPTVSDVTKDILPPTGTVNVNKESQKRSRNQKLTAVPQTEELNSNLLFEFLKEKNADKNQVRKFLATSVYLHSQGVEKFTAPLISKSLKTAQIEKLLNASDCLNKNEKKRFCIKEDKEFILTEAGIRSIIGGNEG